jgi:uncharacterized membrane protein YhaH (DUF805 family)
MEYVQLLVTLLLSFRGSINRKSWWIGAVIVAVAYLADPFRTPSVHGIASPQTMASDIWQFAWLVPYTAITVKRFDDIGLPRWLGYAFGALVGVQLMAWAIGLLPAVPLPTTGSYLIGLYLSVWLLATAMCAFLPGAFATSRYAKLWRGLSGHD